MIRNIKREVLNCVNKDKKDVLFFNDGDTPADITFDYNGNKYCLYITTCGDIVIDEELFEKGNYIDFEDLKNKTNDKNINQILGDYLIDSNWFNMMMCKIENNEYKNEIILDYVYHVDELIELSENEIENYLKEFLDKKTDDKEMGVKKMTINEFEQAIKDVKAKEKDIESISNFIKEANEIAKKTCCNEFNVNMYDDKSESEVGIYLPKEIILQMARKYKEDLKKEYKNIIRELRRVGLKLECDNEILFL